jgi:mono/diheme cytochrome c family protein
MNALRIRVTPAVLSIAIAAALFSTVALGRAEEVDELRLARHDYILNCSGCHRSDGRGVSGAVPSFAALEAILCASGGREYVLRVPGVANAPVDDRRLAKLLDYVAIELAGIENPQRFDEAEVARYRRVPLIDPLAARRSLPIVSGAPDESLCAQIGE